jgi:hypothetical protein
MPTLQDDRPATDRRRYWLPVLSKNPDTRSIQVGLFWTVLVHLLLLLLAPQIFRDQFSPGRFVQPGSSARTYEVELAPQAFLRKPPPPPPSPERFVETNPDANNNIPDKTDNFGAQNQQAAQPVPDKDSTLRMPKTEGKKDFQNDSQVVSGRLENAEPFQPAPPAQEQQEQVAERQDQTQKKLQMPLPGFTKNQGINPDAFGTESVKLPGPSTGADKQVEGDRNAQDLTGTGAQASQASPLRPRPRPRLTQVRPAILQDRPTGVSNAGVIGVDARFSQFGDYLQELIDIVQIQWERILGSSGVSPKPTTHVKISFRLNSKGEIAEIISVEGDAGDYGTNAALTSIKERAPYRPWTKEMVAVLGDNQVITFTYYYW